MLTPAQVEAIEYTEGHLQLIACAGSGKTEVVARRIANILAKPELNTQPANIVAFTFTEKAASELKERILLKVKEQCGEIPGLAEMFVGTIHGFCLKFLQEEIPEYLKFQVLDDTKQKLLIDRYSKASGLTSAVFLDGKPLRRFRDTSRYVHALSLVRENRIDSNTFTNRSVLESLQAYDSLLKQNHFLDYTTIITNTIKQLKSNPQLLAKLASRVKHLFVDEYQDVNSIQEDLIQIISSKGAKVCVVGDDDQTIYQWRGSDVSNILTFASRYQGAKQILLTANHRSSPGVVNLAHSYAEAIEQRLQKKMISAGHLTHEDGDIQSLEFEDPVQEANYIADRIQELVGISFQDKPKSPPRGLAYSDIAVLLRSVKGNAEPIKNALEDRGIPYVVEGLASLFQTIEIAAFNNAFLYIAGEPIDLDSVKASFETSGLINSVSILDKLMASIEQRRTDLHGGEKGPRRDVYNIQRTFLDLIQDMQIDDSSIQGRVTNVRLDKTFYNLGRFSELISDFEAIHFKSDPLRKYQNFAGFLKFTAQDAYDDGRPASPHYSPNAVRIMTVHQSKGLEWPAVFIPAIVSNRFPAKRQGGLSVWHIVSKDDLPSSDRFFTNHEDERRLFYVAITRAKKYLFMSWAPVGENNLYQKASPFFRESYASKYVKRRPLQLSDRPRLPSQALNSVANVNFSFSDLKYFLECPYQFKLRVLYGLNAPLHEALGFGRLLHNVLADLHKAALNGVQPTPSLSEELVERHLSLPYAYPALKQKLSDSAKCVIQKYIVDNENEFSNIEFAEKDIELNLSNGVKISGRIDLVRRKRDTGTEISIVDFKSSERSQAENVTEAQLHIYALGYAELTGRNADLVECYDLDTGLKSPRTVDQSFIEDVKKVAALAADSIRSDQFEPKCSKKLCGSCDFKTLCTAGRKILTS